MERDVLNARPFQRYMPSRYLLQLYNENIDQRYKVTFKDAWYANKNPLSESDLKSLSFNGYRRYGHIYHENGCY